MTKASTQNPDLRTENLCFTDTHCHIHEETYPEQEAAYSRAREAGVTRLIAVGTDAQSSRQAVAFARAHDDVWASVGLHPHDATAGMGAIEQLDRLIGDDRKDHVSKIVAVGECGLDYFYENSPRAQQIEMLHAQLALATTYNVPVIFHVRDSKTPGIRSVWHDFWPIFDSYEGLRGVLHSFTDTMSNMEQGLSRGLLVGVNGISTFTRDEMQREMFASIPVERLLLETDAPFLTPTPHRGKVNEPAFITLIAQYIANLQSISLEELSRATERNATHLFFQTNT